MAAATNKTVMISQSIYDQVRIISYYVPLKFDYGNSFKQYTKF